MRRVIRLIDEMNTHAGYVANLQRVKGGLISGRIYAASSAKTLNGEQLSFANWFLRIM